MNALNCGLPTGWVNTPLAEVGEWRGGGTPSKSEDRYWTNGTIPWVSPKDMKSAVVRDTEDHITPSALIESATQLVPVASVLVVTRSGILRHSLPIAVNTSAVALNQDLKAITPHAGIDASYLAWALRRFEEQILHQCSKTGTTVHSVETAKLMRFAIPLAPTCEQQRIAATIEEQLTNLDAAIAALERARANLKRYRSAVLTAAVEGRLASAMIPTMRSGAKLPAGWDWVKLGEIAEIQGGIQKQPSRRPVSNHYPFLRVANVRRGGLVLDEVHRIELFGSELQRLRLQRGDLLIVEGNGSPTEIGRMAVWDGSIADCVHQNHLIRARPSDRVLPTYLAMYWNSPSGASRVMGVASSTSGLYTLSVSKVQGIPVPLPPLSEQQAIVAEGERRLAVVEHTDAEIDAQLRRAARLRQAVLKRAFEGKLVPQDPSDEPASALLQRIRAERGAAPAPRRRTVHRRSRVEEMELFPEPPTTRR